MISKQEAKINQLQDAGHEMVDQGTLFEFFALLLKVDQRVNPHLYNQLKQENND